MDSLYTLLSNCTCGDWKIPLVNRLPVNQILECRFFKAAERSSLEKTRHIEHNHVTVGLGRERGSCSGCMGDRGSMEKIMLEAVLGNICRGGGNMPDDRMGLC